MSSQIINYTEICSNALLSILDNDEYKSLKNGRYEIPINKKFKEEFTFYIISYYKSYFQFGVNNILINTCRPYDNWRKEERGAPIRSPKYSLTDPDIFSIDKIKLETLLEKVWKSIFIKEKNIICISHNELDYFDLTMVIKELLPYIIIHPTHYYCLRDINNDYIHTSDISINHKTLIEIELRKNNLII